jgi:Transposase DDE domain
LSAITPLLVADDRARQLTWQTTPGQRGDSPMFVPVLEGLRIGRRGPGRPRTRPGRLRGDKAYSSRGNRAYLRRRHIKATIFNGTLTVAAIMIWLRDIVHEPSDTP